MAKKNRLIGVRSTDTVIFLQLVDGCQCIDLVAATLTVSKPHCEPDRSYWVKDACTGRKLYRVVCRPVPQQVTLTAAVRSGGCTGWIAFPLTPEFHALGAGRLNAVIGSVTGKMEVQLQVFEQNISAQCGFATTPVPSSSPTPTPTPTPPGAITAGEFHEIHYIMSVAGTQTVALGRTPTTGGLFQVFINGVLYSSSSDYQIVASTLTMPESMGLQAGDDILVIFN